jgi:hypothetical protein
MAALQGPLHKLVQLVEIDVAPELAGEVADGQSPFVALPEQALVRGDEVMWAPGILDTGITRLKAVLAS